MATFEQYRTARTEKLCSYYPRCVRGIHPGERYLRASASPRTQAINESEHWWTLTICREHMRPEEEVPRG